MENLSPEWSPWRYHRPQNDALIHTTLCSVLLFANLTARDWRDLNGLFHHRHFADGEVVFETGMPGLGMYIVLSGAVRVHELRGGAEVELAKLESGDFFGEVSLIDEAPRSATVTAIGDTELIGIFRPHLKELMRLRPKLGVTLLERLGIIIADRLREANRRFGELHAQVQEKLQ